MSHDRRHPPTEPEQYYPRQESARSRRTGLRERPASRSSDAYAPQFDGGPPRDGSSPRDGGPYRETASRQPGPRAQRRAARRRAQMRRRRVLALAVLVILVGSVAGLLLRSPSSPTETAAGPSAPGPAPSSSVSAKAAAASDPSGSATTATVESTGVPETGPGTFAYAGGTGKVLGTAGTLRKYQIAVEDESGQDAAAFATAVEKILGDSRSWIAGGKTKFQRVPKGSSHEFVIYLATPATSEKMCAAGGLHTERFTSCRISGQVIINLARWLTAIPDYNAPLDVYQAYAINHEVGHQLGLYHEACPGRGQTAPVMQQQTYGLKGCVANSWPYIDGKRYAGPPIP
ncbi:DUF3152 domain-containing protein [Hamadaea sp. NPDC051192]|uniref:DUF3152 domain-containing protein n=1 Tax=Hamadaea sp. NPDC051192 TaxID=3154940 RepID=UPI0034444F8B